MQLTLTFLEPPPPKQPPLSQELRDAEARAEALKVLARIIAQAYRVPVETIITSSAQAAKLSAWIDTWDAVR